MGKGEGPCWAPWNADKEVPKEILGQQTVSQHDSAEILVQETRLAWAKQTRTILGGKTASTMQTTGQPTAF